MTDCPRMIAGVSLENHSLFYQLQFTMCDSAVFFEMPDGERVAMVRDLEVDQARRFAQVDRAFCPASYPPEGGPPADRDLGMALSAVEFLRRNGWDRVAADRSLGLLYVDTLQRAGITVELDSDWPGALRRMKSEEEIKHIAASQSAAESAMALACEMVANASVTFDGTLEVDHGILTAECLKRVINTHLTSMGYHNAESIVAPGPQGAVGHHHGDGAIRTGTSVIIDIFPQSMTTRYYADCTRTVCHGEIPEELQTMHDAVVAAKAAGIAAVHPGVTGDAVHAAVCAEIESFGFRVDTAGSDEVGCFTHGTGHGVGLEVHEVPLLSKGQGELRAGDVVTIEPGIYRKGFGGVRLEDIVVVTENGCCNLNSLREDLEWL
ncbi:MAG: aminopeptidase P family protein [Phycisphaerales bacterium]|nr:aminopeptidase P family protein [Phycisphaerales bacterium]MBT7171083.1 aminopeptidase P family protein [Phycisphaerales bacterium]